MRAFSRLVALLGVLALAWTAAAADLEVGRKIYAQKCAGCHGADGKGNPKMAEMLKVTIPNLTNGPGKTEAELAKIISEGKPPMPSFGKSLSRAELGALVDYAHSLAGGQSAKKK
jgi:mono/diheme cytochrome c family protein